MTILRMDPRMLDKWMHQNSAEYTGDFLDGVMLDNFVVWTKRGAAAFYENALNSWSSEYRVEFEPGDAPNVWKRWEAFEEQYVAEYGIA